MTDFKSRFVYPIFILRLLYLVALLVGISLFIFIGIPSLIRKHHGLKAFGLIAFGLSLLGYLIMVFGRSTLTQRYNISITNGQTMLHDNLFGRRIVLDENFKGFSLSSYGDSRGIYDFKTLIFYFSNGHKIEFPQFLYTNFKEIMPSLTEHSIKFLGHEPFRWKNLLFRRYYFD